MDTTTPTTTTKQYLGAGVYLNDDGLEFTAALDERAYELFGHLKRFAPNATLPLDYLTAKDWALLDYPSLMLLVWDGLITPEPL